MTLKPANAFKRGMTCLLWAAFGAAAMLGGGCATNHGISPLAAQLLTTGAVIEGLKNSPNTAAKLSVIQPVVCQAATGQAIKPEDLLRAIELTGVGDKDTYALVNIIMAIYVTAVPPGTNAPDAHPWAKAVWCDGMANGLAYSLPGPKAPRNAIPRVAWPRMLK